MLEDEKHLLARRALETVSLLSIRRLVGISQVN